MAKTVNKNASLTEQRVQTAIASIDKKIILPIGCWAMTVVLHYEDDTSLTFDVVPEDEHLPELPAMRQRKRRRKT